MLPLTTPGGFIAANTFVKRDVRRVAGVDTSEIRTRHRVEGLDLVVRDVGDVVEQVDRNTEYGLAGQPGFDAERGEFDRPSKPRRDRSDGDNAGR